MSGGKAASSVASQPLSCRRALATSAALLVLACGGETANTTGETSTAGSGGASAGAAGSDSPGGASQGGASNGGASQGGASNGGASQGGATNGGASQGGATNGGASQGGSGPTVRVPKMHRPSVVPCDGVRPDTEPGVPAGAFGVECTTNAECTGGVNGRCNGNSHDGWRCTYDQCVDDDACGGGVCQCNGGFRSDHDVCLKSTCRIDADCGESGFCSPSLGSCGTFSKIVTYACHTPNDKCIDDEDCASQGGGSCRFEQSVGWWKCSTMECVG